jgi:hypothetical protein
MRLVLVLASLALLGGCNVLMTKEPLFSKADEAGAPRMRPGVWGNDQTDQCKYDQTQPFASWPDCAGGVVVERDDRVGSFDRQSGKPVWTTTPFLIAAGDPRVGQVHLSANMGGAPLPAVYIYAAVRPTALDDKGFITATTSWIVLCGPPPPPDAKAPDGQSQRSGTLEPVAGLTMDASANDCVTTSKDAARRAARESQAWTKPDGFTNNHWVRDGDH